MRLLDANIAIYASRVNELLFYMSVLCSIWQLRSYCFFGFAVFSFCLSTNPHVGGAFVFHVFSRPRVKKEPIVIESAKAKKPSVMDYPTQKDGTISHIISN